MRKKLLLTVIAALAAILCAFAFVACGSGKKGTTRPADTAYVGALSAETYTSPELAAKAFIDVEICGDVTDATFVSYTKTADLTADEVAALDISAAEKANIASVEKGEVKYTVAASESDSNVQTSADEEKTYLVIIVKYNDQTVKYYSPMLNTGDPLTKSYYDKIFSPDNFKNLTLNSTVDFTMSASLFGIKISSSGTTKVSAKWDEDSYGYINTESTVDLGLVGVVAGEGGPTTIITEQFYVNDKTSRFYGCSFSRTTMNGEAGEWSLLGTPKGPDWTYSPDDESNSVEFDWVDGYEGEDDALSVFLPEFDYSYFIKTKTGFKINSEKLSEYLEIVLVDALEQVGMSVKETTLGKTTATADYYVSDGKITESVETLNFNFELGNDVGSAYSMKEKTVVKYSDYGTTVVTVPSDLVLDNYL